MMPGNGMMPPNAMSPAGAPPSPAPSPVRAAGPIGRMVSGMEGQTAATQAQTEMLKGVMQMLAHQAELLSGMTRQLTRIAALLEAPKHVALQTDEIGRATGAVVRPVQG